MTAALPFRESVEKAALSAFFQWPHLLDEHGAVGVDHFYLEGHRVLFERVRTEWAKSKNADHLDLVTFGAKLYEDGTADRLGGIAFVSECFGAVPTPSHIRQHVEILSSYRARRMAILAARELEAAALDTADENFMDRAGEPITTVIEAAANAKPPRSTKQVILECFERFEKRVKGEVSPMGISTITEIDEALRGLKPGRVWVIGAYPSGGKSLLAGQILADAALDGNATLYLTLEMSEDDLMDRCVIQTSRVPSGAFMDPRSYAQENGNNAPTTGHIQALKRMAASLAAAPLFLAHPANRKLQTLLAAIRRAKRSHDIKAVAIDYLQLIQAKRQHGDSKEQEVAEISHAFQAIAQELGIHILILTQLNADGETKHGRVIEEDADAFLTIVQDRNRDSETFKQHQHIQIVKDRHHGQGGRKLPLILNYETLRFAYGLPPEREDKPKTRFANR